MLHFNSRSFLALLLITLAAAGLHGQPALAQEGLPGSAEAMSSTIAGTAMTHDEFRARGYAQLVAVALNAHAYFAVNNDFPPSYYDLFNSDAWNLDVTNIFSGRTVNEIAFTPKPADMTSELPLAIPLGDQASGAMADQTGPPPDLHELTGPGGALEHGFKLDAKDLTKAAQTQVKTSTPRVNPAAIQPRPSGDIFYYAKNGLLQLVMFAPDGTYVEYVTTVPNRGWLDQLAINSDKRSFPADLFANEVLLFLERLLPRQYNLVRFMAGTEPVPEHELQAGGAETRLKWARELSITVFNPYSKRAIKVLPKATPGELVVADKTKPVPITLALKSGEVVSFMQLSRGAAPDQGRPAAPAAPAKPAKPKGPPPLGGRH